MPTTIEKPKKNDTGAAQRAAVKTELAELEGKLAELQDKIHALKAAEAPKLILPELHAKNGRIDAQKVADFLCIPLKRFAEGLGLNYKAVHRDPSGESFQEALQPVKKTLEYLHSFYPKPEHQRIWLNTPHPMLEQKTALEIILEGKAFATDRLLGNAWNGVWS